MVFCLLFWFIFLLSPQRLCGSCIPCPALFLSNKSERSTSHRSQLHHYHKLESSAWRRLINVCCRMSPCSLVQWNSMLLSRFTLSKTVKEGTSHSQPGQLGFPLPLDAGVSAYSPSIHHCSKYKFSGTVCYACYLNVLPIKHRSMILFKKEFYNIFI